jgi:hypothetical protein
MSEVIEPLAPTEQAELAECEAVVREGLRTFVEVGQALMRIRDGRLYRATHATFDGYVRDQFGVGQAYAHRLIGAAAVALSPIGDKITNEAQARELVPLLDDPERMEQVVKHAERGWGNLTAKALRSARDDVAAEHMHEPQLPDPSPEAETAVREARAIMGAEQARRAALGDWWSMMSSALLAASELRRLRKLAEGVLAAGNTLDREKCLPLAASMDALIAEARWIAAACHGEASLSDDDLRHLAGDT